MKRLLQIVVTLAAICVVAPRLHAQVIVIANPGLKADSVTKTELRDVFTGAASSVKGGGHVVPALLKQGTTHGDFSTTYLNKSPVALLICWRGLVMTSQAAMPKILDSEDAMVEYVARTSGAIGYIGKGTAHDNVKVLEVR